MRFCKWRLDLGLCRKGSGCLKLGLLDMDFVVEIYGIMNVCYVFEISFYLDRL